MPLVTGTHTIADLVENTFANDLVVDNIDGLNDAIQRDLAMHNARVADMVSDLCEISTERSTVYGTNAQGEAVSKDEFTRAPTQKITLGSKVEFPLDGFEYAVGWTADYLRRATVQDMARKTIAARQAHVRRIQFDVKRALFGPTNFTWRDRRVDNLDLAVKRLVNADSGPIPNGPNGEQFNAATHTHYEAIDWGAANAAARIAAVQALVQDVVEHGHGSDVRIYINRAQETDFRALTPNFTPLPPPNITEAENTQRVTGRTLDITRADNRLIGYFDGFPVFTKPWVPANYVFAFSAGDPSKTLRKRVSTLASEQGLFIAGEIITHPLQAQYMNFVHGFGVIGRTNGAILFLGAGTYAEPTFTL
jgi:hypothetical protein